MGKTSCGRSARSRVKKQRNDFTPDLRHPSPFSIFHRTLLNALQSCSSLANLAWSIPLDVTFTAYILMIGLRWEQSQAKVILAYPS